MAQHNGLCDRPSPSAGSKVYLVGAGPGDPGLITLRAVACLGLADVVLYDYLVNPAVLEYAPPRAERIPLGHHPGANLSQKEICRRMVEAAQAGRTVVRLKGGDPSVFGRVTDEIAALQQAGIPFEVVPGVTAATAVAAYTGIPLTHAGCSSAVALVTGQQRHCKAGPALDYGALADFPGTVVFYMGVTSAAQWSQAMLERGKPADTPVAIVRRCSWTDQAVYRCTLGTVAEEIARHGIRPPAVIVVGEVVEHAPERWWFSELPLMGQRIVVTRPRHQAQDLGERLCALGAEVLYQPAIEIGPPEDWGAVDRTLERLGQYEWIVFSSANGVNCFMERLVERGLDVRSLAGIKLAAMGPGTAEALARYHLRADLVPDQFRAEALAAALAPSAAGQRCLLIRASRGREVLAEQLAAAGANVEQVVAYRSIDVPEAALEVTRALREGRVAWITVTSSAIAGALVRLFGEDLRRARLASISPVTSETLRRLGFAPSAEADPYTMEGLVAAIVRASSVSPGMGGG